MEAESDKEIGDESRGRYNVIAGFEEGRQGATEQGMWQPPEARKGKKQIPLQKGAQPR